MCQVTTPYVASEQVAERETAPRELRSPFRDRTHPRRRGLLGSEQLLHSVQHLHVLFRIEGHHLYEQRPNGPVANWS